MANKISFPIDDETIVAVQLTAIDGLMTNLNPNLSIGTKYATAVATGDMIAIFEGGAIHPTQADGASDIPINGIPTGDYKVQTCNTAPDPYWAWDDQTEVENITIVNQDLKEIFDLYIRENKIYDGHDKIETGFVLDAHQGKVLYDAIAQNTTNIATNTDNISANTTAISTNANNISVNTAARHTQGTDQHLDFGGENEVSAAQAKEAYMHSQDSTIHLTAEQKTALTNGGDSTGHYHETDRNRANHTGTQSYTTITGLGALATRNSVDLSGDDVIHKNADNIEETASRKWAAESGAQKNYPEATAAEMEAGTEAGLRSMSPLRVKQAISYNIAGLMADPTGIVPDYLGIIDGNEHVTVKIGKIEIGGISAVGNYTVDYFWSATPQTSDVNWDTTTHSTVVSLSNHVSIPKPAEGDSIYGTAGQAYIIFRIRFENQAGTSLSNPQGSPYSISEVFDEPSSGASADEIVAILAAGGENANLVIQQIATILSGNPKAMAMIAANVEK